MYRVSPGTGAQERNHSVIVGRLNLSGLNTTSDIRVVGGRARDLAVKMVLVVQPTRPGVLKKDGRRLQRVVEDGGRRRVGARVDLVVRRTDALVMVVSTMLVVILLQQRTSAFTHTHTHTHTHQLSSIGPVSK